MHGVCRARWLLLPQGRVRGEHRRPWRESLPALGPAAAPWSSSVRSLQPVHPRAVARHHGWVERRVDHRVLPVDRRAHVHKPLRLLQPLPKRPRLPRVCHRSRWHVPPSKRKHAVGRHRPGADSLHAALLISTTYATPWPSERKPVSYATAATGASWPPTLGVARAAAAADVAGAVAPTRPVSRTVAAAPWSAAAAFGKPVASAATHARAVRLHGIPRPSGGDGPQRASDHHSCGRRRTRRSGGLLPDLPTHRRLLRVRGVPCTLRHVLPARPRPRRAGELDDDGALRAGRAPLASSALATAFATLAAVAAGAPHAALCTGLRAHSAVPAAVAASKPAAVAAEPAEPPAVSAVAAAQAAAAAGAAAPAAGQPLPPSLAAPSRSGQRWIPHYNRHRT